MKNGENVSEGHLDLFYPHLLIDYISYQNIVLFSAETYQFSQ